MILNIGLKVTSTFKANYYRDIYYAKYYGKGGGWEKDEKGERKKEENYIKNGGKGLKNASFWAINSKKNISLNYYEKLPTSLYRR